MPYTAPEQALRVASAISAVTTGCCLRYGVFANVLRSRPVSASIEADSSDSFHYYYDLLRTIVITDTEDQVQRTGTWLVCRIAVPEPAERHFLQGYHRWSVEWVEVAGVGGPILTTDPVLLSMQGIVGLREGPSGAADLPGAVRLIATPGQVPLELVVEKYMCGPRRASARISSWLLCVNGVRIHCLATACKPRCAARSGHHLPTGNRPAVKILSHRRKVTMKKVHLWRLALTMFSATLAGLSVSVLTATARPLSGTTHTVGDVCGTTYDAHQGPVITLTAPLNNQIVSSTQLLIAGQTEPAAQLALIEVSLNDGASWATAAGTMTFAYTWTVPLEDGAPHLTQLRLTDQTGNIAFATPVQIMVDRIAPQTSLLDPMPGQVIRSHAYTLSGKDQDGLGVSRVQVSTDDGATWAEAILGERVWSYNWTIPAEDGVSHLLRVTGTDVAGNSSAPPSTVAVFVDNVPPLISFSNLPMGGVTTIPSHTFTVIGTSSGALTTTLDWGGVPQAVSVINNVFTRTLSLPAGTYALRVIAVDAVGNSSVITTTLIVSPQSPGPQRVFLPVVLRNCDAARDAYEVDDTFTVAPSIAADGSLQHRNFYPTGDVDWARLDVTPGTYLITTSGLATDTDTVLRLYAANGVTRLAENDDCTPYTRASCLTWTANAATTLYIQLTPYNSQSVGADRWYDLSVVIP